MHGHAVRREGIENDEIIAAFSIRECQPAVSEHDLCLRSAH